MPSAPSSPRFLKRRRSSVTTYSGFPTTYSRRVAAGWLWGACDGLLTPRPLGPLFDIAAQAGKRGVARTDPPSLGLVNVHPHVQGVQVAHQDQARAAQDVQAMITAAGRTLPQQMTHFKSDLMLTYDWSRDGALVCTRGSSVSNVVALTHPKDAQ